MIENLTEAQRNAQDWRDEARRLRHEGEALSRYAGERFDAANRADEQADYWQRLVEAREHELRVLARKAAEDGGS
jgi:hypothetical protein